MKPSSPHLSKAQPLTLAFSGGGAKCAAQAGVLSVLEEARLPVGAIVGLSAGGLVAVLYGLGYAPAAIRDYIANTSLLEVWEFDATQRAIFGPEKIRARLRTVVGDKTFADLRLPVTVLAVDMNSEREVRLNSGRLEDAVMATMALPTFFTPVTLGAMRLVDGGVFNPLPVDVAREMGQRVVAVDVVHDHSPTEPTQIFEARGPMRYATAVGRRLRLTEIVESAYQMGVVITNHMIEHNLRDNPADVLIRPAVGKVGLFAFDLAGTAYEMGRAAAQAALPQLEALVYPKTTSRLAAAWKRAAAVIRRQRARQATGR
ncbi:MAG TPA: patatin-like phospholipase family protein [Anaerolineales bacterium]|nr:patatin-like phospholipase family protein [Anaerolineales bacterium]